MIVNRSGSSGRAFPCLRNMIGSARADASFRTFQYSPGVGFVRGICGLRSRSLLQICWTFGFISIKYLILLSVAQSQTHDAGPPRLSRVPAVNALWVSNATAHELLANHVKITIDRCSYPRTGICIQNPLLIHHPTTCRRLLDAIL